LYLLADPHQQGALRAGGQLIALPAAMMSFMQASPVLSVRGPGGAPPIPERLDLKAMIKFAPEGITRPVGCWTSCEAVACPT